MRARTMSAGVLVAVLVACTFNTPRDDVAPQHEPLEVTLLPELQAQTVVPSLSFVLNRPAYVAAFAVIPGRGMLLLYPAGSTDDESNAGLNVVTETPFFYADYLLPPFVTPVGQPHYLYIVASDEPLNLGTLSEPAGLRNMFGVERFASATPSYFLDHVTSYVIQPGTTDASWASDMVMDWSGAGGVDLTLATTQLRCDDGSLIIVPLSYGSVLCPGDALRTHPVVASYDAPQSSQQFKNTRKPPTSGSANVRMLAAQRAARQSPKWGNAAPQVSGGFLGWEMIHLPSDRPIAAATLRAPASQHASEPRPAATSASSHPGPAPLPSAPARTPPSSSPPPQRIHPAPA
ncbi:MAG TPA: hypothetical protein VF118_16870 [Gemmatimonadaceae bacterium]